MNKNNKLVSIIIPVYKTQPDAAEILSLQQCFRILSQHDIIFIAPDSLNVDFYQQESNNYSINVRFERFPDIYFKDITGYNQLVLSEKFYQTFLNYSYILIYQLDAFVFKDELEKWCLKNYDYIASPWMDENFVRRFWTNNSRIGNMLNNLGIEPNAVGNGGFSLRKVSKCLFILKLFRSKVKNWDSNEDIFWCLYAPYYFPFIRFPSKKEALQFSFETQPSTCYQLNGKQLPMGCHGWEKYEPEFWANYIKQ